jgi:DNA-binding GntR family transcriptional regulator
LDTVQTQDHRRYKSAADVAYSQLRRRILDGSLPPGGRIDQDAEAAILGLSRMPLREALRRLEAEGLVSVVRHGGAFVRDLSLEDLDDLYLLRNTLEGLAGRLGTERLTDDDLEAIKRLVPAMEEVVQDPSLDAWLRIDWQFHSILYSAAGHPRLVELIRMLLEESARYRHMILSDPTEVRVAFEHHQQIIAACGRRDSGQVATIIQYSIDLAHQKLRKLIAVREATTGE